MQRHNEDDSANQVGSLIWNRNTITDIPMLRAPTVAYSRQRLAALRAGSGGDKNQWWRWKDFFDPDDVL
jgi:hypothetical protein